MPENEGDTPCFIPRTEFNLYHDKMIENIEANRGMIDKLAIILHGNSKDGLIMMVHKLMWRNQYIDKGVSLLIGVLSSVITALLIMWLGG